jgi:hypothetical protein
MQRRSLLKLGIGAAALVAVAGGGVAMWRPGLVQGRLTRSGVAVFHAVARAVLDGSLPGEPVAREQVIQAHLHRLDDAIGNLSPATSDELSQLLALLASMPGRRWIAGLNSDWPEARVSELQSALQDMRTSSLPMRQQIYHALRDLTNAAFYAADSVWSLMGYPGPTPV